MLLSRLIAFGFLGLATTAGAATLDGLAVEVTNTSEPVLCAEKDNVAINFASPDVRHFQIEAVHPAYMGALQQDRWEPDWTACEDISEETSTKPHPTMSTLYEDGNVRIIGLSFTEFWRPSDVTVTIGSKVERNIHLLQLLKKRGDKAVEVLVIYPGDGYWRIKPLPEERFGDGVYGSSFLLGPVEQGIRPVVDIASIRIVPKPLAIHLRFARGGSAVAKVSEVSRTRTALDVRLSSPTANARPFAVLRSMYVAPDNADVSEVRWQESPRAAEQVLPLPDVKTLSATQVRFGRSLPSRHNTSAPDISFGDFDNRVSR